MKKITVNTEELKKAIEKLYKVVARKSDNDVLKNILLNADTESGELFITASNLTQFARMKIPADITSTVQFVFSETKTILKAMKFFTADNITLEYIEEQKDDKGKIIKAGEVNIICGEKKAKQKIIESELFPAFPEISEELLNDCHYSNAKLKERFDAISYAPLTGETPRSILKGVHFCKSDMVTTDNYRLVLNKDESFEVETSFTIPCDTLKYVNQVLEEELHIISDIKFIKFTDNNGSTIITRLYESDYIDYRRVLKNEGKYRITIDVKNYVENLKYLKTIAPGKIEAQWYKNKIGAEADKGEYESEVYAIGEMPFEIAFNIDYMIEALCRFKNKVIITLDSEIKPMMITSEEDINNVALILPVRPKTNKMFEKITS